MSKFINKKVTQLPLSGIRKFFDLVLESGDDIISLGVGEPDFESPWHIREAAIYTLEKGFTSFLVNQLNNSIDYQLVFENAQTNIFALAEESFYKKNLKTK